VKVWPPNPELSTVIEAVPCPSVTFPADTVQVKVSFANEGASTLAVNLSMGPVSVSGHSTEIIGHNIASGVCEYIRPAPEKRTTIANKSIP
jgi:hypothetical protein